jgi:hypothetical protein
MADATGMFSLAVTPARVAQVFGLPVDDGKESGTGGRDDARADQDESEQAGTRPYDPRILRTGRLLAGRRIGHCSAPICGNFKLSRRD